MLNTKLWGDKEAEQHQQLTSPAAVLGFFGSFLLVDKDGGGGWCGETSVNLNLLTVFLIIQLAVAE